MRKLGQLNNQEELQACYWYLYSFGIKTHFDQESPEDLDLWVLSEDDMAKARQIYGEFIKNPQSPAFMNPIEKGKKESLADQAKQTQIEKLQVNVRKKVFGSSSWGAMPLTWGIIGFCILLFILGQFDPRGTLIRLFTISNDHFGNYVGIKSFYEVRQGQVWRLVTPIFLHGGIFHIFFNMYWLYLLGKEVELKDSRRQYIFLILFIAALSNSSYYLVAGPSFLGMSGVIYGLVGYIWARDTFEISSAYRMDDQIIKFFVIWSFICWALTAIRILGVANTVHGMGAVSGILYGLMVAKKQNQKSNIGLRFSPENKQQLLVLAALVGGGMVVDFLTYGS